MDKLYDLISRVVGVRETVLQLYRSGKSAVDIAAEMEVVKTKFGRDAWKYADVHNFIRSHGSDAVRQGLQLSKS